MYVQQQTAYLCLKMLTGNNCEIWYTGMIQVFVIYNHSFVIGGNGFERWHAFNIKELSLLTIWVGNIISEHN